MTINAPPLVGKIALYESCADMTPLACQANELAVTGLTPGATYYLQVWLEADAMGRFDGTPENLSGGFILDVQDTTTLSVDDIENDKNQIQMFPNPANDVLTISAPTTIAQVTIYDMAGKLILSNTNTRSTSETIEVAQLSSGMYMVQIKTTSKTTLKKLIIN
jgi:hypothetical protein